MGTVDWFHSIFHKNMGDQNSKHDTSSLWAVDTESWSQYQNMDMCYQGDAEIIHNWRKNYSIDDLRKIVERKGYSAISIGSFGHAALKKFNYQLEIKHCAPTKGYTNVIHIFTPTPKQKMMNEEKRAAQIRKNASEGWSEHVNMDMCGQGDVEFIKNWRNTHSIDDLKRIAENKSYSAFSIGGFDFAAFKKFNYQLNIDHCKPSKGYSNSIWIFNPEMKKKEEDNEKFNINYDGAPDVAPPPYAL